MQDTLLWLEHKLAAPPGTMSFTACSSFCRLILMPDGLVLNTQETAVIRVLNPCARTCRPSPTGILF